MLVMIDSAELTKLQEDLESAREAYTRTWNALRSAANTLDGFCRAKGVQPPGPILSEGQLLPAIQAALLAIAGRDFEVKC